VINLTPQKTKTLVLPLTAHEVFYRLERAAVPPENAPQQFTPLMGGINAHRFQLALRARRPNSFAPIATGTIDETSTGCLVFITYTLTPSTRFYLIFCSLIILISGAIVGFFYKNILLWLASLAILTFVHGVAWGNFKLHRRPLHNTLIKALE